MEKPITRSAREIKAKLYWDAVAKGTRPEMIRRLNDVHCRVRDGFNAHADEMAVIRRMNEIGATMEVRISNAITYASLGNTLPIPRGFIFPDHMTMQ